MPTIRHCFRVGISFRYPAPPGPSTTGIHAHTGEEVELIGRQAGLAVTGSDAGRQIDVDMVEDDPRLTAVYECIWDTFHLKPSRWHVVPRELRDTYFGVRKLVTWTKREIDACELLWLRNTQLIATHANATAEQLEREIYVAELDHRQRSATQFGSLMPFTALAVAEPLRSQLLAAELKGLHLPEVEFRPPNRKVIKPLWGLKSSIILPKPLNLLQGEDGNAVEPNTEWWCWWDDGGRDPAVLRYKREELSALGPFDIAMTLERVGQTEQGAYRQCIVNQRFRETLARLKVKGVDYVPVELV